MIFNKFKKLKKLLKKIFILIFTVIIAIISIKFYKFISSYTELENKLPSLSVESDFKLEENLIKELIDTSKLLTLEMELSQTLKIDKSIGYSELFVKYRYIKYFADCSYFVDMSKLNKSDIIVDNINKKITLVIPKPEIYSININKDKTSLSESVNGLFRFGELNLSFEELKDLEENVYNSFKETISKDDIYKKALASSDTAVRQFVSNLTENDMEILLYFK